LAYNFQSNRVVKTTYQTIKDSLVKMYTEDIKKWYEYTLYILDRLYDYLEIYRNNTILYCL